MWIKDEENRIKVLRMHEPTILAVNEVGYITDKIMSFTDETISWTICSTSTFSVALVLELQEEGSNQLNFVSWLRINIICHQLILIDDEHDPSFITFLSSTSWSLYALYRPSSSRPTMVSFSPSLSSWLDIGNNTSELV